MKQIEANRRYLEIFGDIWRYLKLFKPRISKQAEANGLVATVELQFSRSAHKEDELLIQSTQCVLRVEQQV